MERRTSYSAKELLQAHFPEPRWLVPGLLPEEGLGLLAGRPKLGKSWLALQLACAVGCGGRFLSQQTAMGRVLYLALEDSPRRLQERMKKQHWPPDADVDFEFAWGDLVTTPNGLSDLQTRLVGGGYKLCIIDTFSRVATYRQSVNEDVTVVLASLQDTSFAASSFILCVDHHRKPFASQNDAVDDVIGSTAKAGVSDCVWGLYRQRGTAEATLKCVGRDFDDIELALDWDRTTCCWQPAGPAGLGLRSKVQSDIIDLLSGAEDGGLTVSRLAVLLDKPVSNVSREIAELRARGVVVQGVKCGREQFYQLSPGLSLSSLN